MCAEGPCESSLVVRADGRWTYSDQSGESDGQLTADQQADLSAAVGETGLSGVAAATGCQADSDGTSVRYVWSDGDREGSASSCGAGLDEDDTLVVEVESLVDELGLGGRPTAWMPVTLHPRCPHPCDALGCSGGSAGVGQSSRKPVTAQKSTSDPIAIPTGMSQPEIPAHR